MSEFIDNKTSTDLQHYANSFIAALNRFVEELKKLVNKVWNIIKKAVNKAWERIVISMQNESAKRTIYIYQRTKNKRIKKKKFKQLVGYLVEKITV